MPYSLARTLRRNSTEAERRLWFHLRNRQLHGHKFRRQVPLGALVAEFACLSHRLVVEIDGGQHAWRAEQDAARTAWLKSNGFRVLRFWNNNVLDSVEGVLEAIREALQPPHPDPPPRRGEGDQ